MTHEEAASLLQKYLDGNTNEVETALVEEWYGLTVSKNILSPDRKLQIADDMRAHIHAAISQPGFSKKSILHTTWFRLAAIMLVVLSVGFTFWKLGVDHVAELIAFTGKNERKEVTLPDGSTIILEPLSRISYPSHFATENRTVKLAGGDVFFNIQHDEKRPFSVQLQSKVQVNVLGTSFRIRDVKKDDLLKVTVATGKVEICKDSKAIDTLIKGEEISLSRSSGHTSVYTAAVPNIVELSFDSSSLAEVIQKMEYVYSIKIAVNNPRFLKLKCTARFNSAQSANEILEILCSLHHLKLSVSNNHKTFKIYK